MSWTLLLPLLGWVQATDNDGVGLAWDPERTAVEWAVHQDLRGVLPDGEAHAAIERAFDSWADVPDHALEFIQLGRFTGVACPHVLPPPYDADPSEVCGAAVPDVDQISTVFFLDQVWPWGPEVIGLTTVTWAEGGELVDSDIALNGVDFRWSTTDDPTTCDVDPSSCAVDLESIVLHEAGHLLGLDHTDAAGAVMRADYVVGTLARDLDSDDIAGVRALYPCEGGVCGGGQGCRGGGAAWLGLVAVLGAGLLRRRGAAVLPLGLAVVLVPSVGWTTSVLRLDLDELTLRSQAVVRVTVQDVRSRVDRVVWTDYELEVTEVLAGEAPERLSLTLPGGSEAGWSTVAFGTPRLRAREDAVLFVEQRAGRWRVVGLEQGRLSVGADGALSRSLSGLHLVEPGGTAVAAPLPARLDDLRGRLKSVSSR